MPLNFQTVASFDFAPQAWIFRNQLADYGLDPFVVDEHMATINWNYLDAIGGVKVVVPSSQIPMAEELLDSLKKHSIADMAIEKDADAIGVKCRKCGSANTSSSGLSKRWIYYIWMVVGIPFPVFASSCYCYRCGFREGPPTTFSRPIHIAYLFGLAVLTVVALTALGC